MVNNFEQIKGLLKFRSDDDFYFLQVLKRRKDHKDGEKVSGVSNNARLVKAYFIKSVEHLDYVMPEIIEMCKLFNARAGINLNRRSFEKMALQHLRKVTEQIIGGTFNKAHKAYSSVVGAYNHGSDKSWILDIDYPSPLEDDMNLEIFLDQLKDIQPVGDKFIAKIVSKNGFHLITKPFNIQEAKCMMDIDDISVHKNNPTNIFCP